MPEILNWSDGYMIFENLGIDMKLFTSRYAFCIHFCSAAEVLRLSNSLRFSLALFCPNGSCVSNWHVYSFERRVVLKHVLLISRRLTMLLTEIMSHK